MKYFAKYLPVEGEIKMLNWYFDKDGELHLYQGCLPQYHYIGAKLAKLFLCSRDIKVGDELKDLQGQSQLCVIPEFVNQETHFKVIGETSPDALSYVTEGQEFDENEVRKATDLEIYWADASKQFQNRTIYGNVDQSYSPKQGDTYNESITNERIEVKCSCCKKFH